MHYTDWEEWSYLKFKVRGLLSTPKKVWLRLTSADPIMRTGRYHLYLCSDTWTEATLTFGARPVLSRLGTSYEGMTRGGQVLQFDVTSLVTSGGTYSFALLLGDPSSLSARG